MKSHYHLTRYIIISLVIHAVLFSWLVYQPRQEVKSIPLTVIITNNSNQQGNSQSKEETIIDKQSKQNKQIEKNVSAQNKEVIKNEKGNLSEQYNEGEVMPLPQDKSEREMLSGYQSSTGRTDISNESTIPDENQQAITEETVHQPKLSKEEIDQAIRRLPVNAFLGGNKKVEDPLTPVASTKNPFSKKESTGGSQILTQDFNIFDFENQIWGETMGLVLQVEVDYTNKPSRIWILKSSGKETDDFFFVQVTYETMWPISPPLMKGETKIFFVNIQTDTENNRYSFSN